MIASSVFAVILLAPLGASMSPGVSSLLSFDEAGAKARPVNKVIILLKDMLAQMEKDADADEALYDKMACWCIENEKTKTQSIAKAQAEIADLTTSIEQGTARVAQYTTEVDGLNKEVAADSKALDEATAIRQKQFKEFNNEEKDLLMSISSLKSAVVVLGKHNAASSTLIQADSKAALQGVASTLQQIMSNHHAMLLGALSPHEKREVASFVQAPEDYVASSPKALLQAQQAPSGEIYGILGQMKETFESNLATTQKEEKSNEKSYGELKVAKEAQIAAGQEQVDTKTQELAAAQEKKALDNQDLVDTKATLSGDVEFLAMLKEKCAVNDSEWTERQKSRQLETASCSKALEVLTSDEAHDSFGKSFNPSFVQVDSSISSERRSKATTLLQAMAVKRGRPQMMTLATSIRLDAFGAVKKSIDGMVVALKKEKADEVILKDSCVTQTNENVLNTEAKIREKNGYEAKIEDFTQRKSTIKSAIADLEAELADAQKQLQVAGEVRTKQNAEFKRTVADQQATQKLLAQALNVLKSVYDKKAGAAAGSALLQIQVAKDDPPPPAGFSGYKQNGASGGVMALLQQIINDAKAIEAEAKHDEAAAITAYEVFTKATKASSDIKTEKVMHAKKHKATVEANLVQATKDKASNGLELEQLSNAKANIHAECDFVTKNFDIRQAGRDEEIEALKQAKAILSGSNFGFLQKA